MSRQVDTPITVRLMPGDRAVLDAMALRRNITRAELIRRLVADAIGREQLGRAELASVRPAGDHRVHFAHPMVPDGASDEIKQAVAVRIETALTGECPDCGVHAVVDAEAQQDRLLAPARPAVKPSISPAPKRAVAVRVLTAPASAPAIATTTIVFPHDPGCAAVKAGDGRITDRNRPSGH